MPTEPLHNGRSFRLCDRPRVHVYVHFYALWEGRQHWNYTIGPRRILSLASAYGHVVRREVFVEVDTLRRTAYERTFRTWMNAGFRILTEPAVRVFKKGANTTVRPSVEHSQLVDTLVNSFTESLPDIVVLVVHHQVPSSIVHNLLERGVRVILFKTTAKPIETEEVFSHCISLRDWAGNNALPENPFHDGKPEEKVTDLFRCVDRVTGTPHGSSVETLARTDSESYNLLRRILGSGRDDVSAALADLDRRQAGGNVQRIILATLLALAAIPDGAEEDAEAVLETDALWKNCLRNEIPVDLIGRWALHILKEAGLVDSYDGGAHPDDVGFFFTRAYNDPIHALARAFVERHGLVEREHSPTLPSAPIESEQHVKQHAG